MLMVGTSLAYYTHLLHYVYISSLLSKKIYLPVISKTEKTNESFLVLGLHICDEKASREYSWLAVTGWFRGPGYSRLGI
jgi:hypothetical protein